MDSNLTLPNLKFDNAAGAKPTAQEFHQILRAVIAQISNPQKTMSSEETERWTSFIFGLSDNFCASFVLPGSMSWNAMKDKITFLKTALEGIYQAALHVEGLFSQKLDPVGTLVVRLLNICNVLDVWLDGQVEIEDGIPSPTTLRELAFKALVAVLRSLGGSITRFCQPEEPRWKVLRILLTECTELVSGVSW